MKEEKVLWPGWETVRLIGRGSFGAVYEIERDVFGHKEKAALKVITIPQSDSDIEELYDSGYDKASVTATFKSHLESIVNEYSLMREMNGAANVVNCDDFRIVAHDDNIGWDIFIKMELLTPLTKALGKQPSDEQVIQIAKDMCGALILCKKYGIIHRDIKPQNIFVSKNGDYKLGDFGIAKTIEKTSGGTKIGTYKYMAPEVYNNQPYNLTADIYSLGLVLHWMLNERRSPFMPLPPAPAVASQEDEARAKRFNGTPIPAPAHGSEDLKRIVLKACAYDSKDRFQSAEEMLSALQGLEGSKWKPSEIATDAHELQEEEPSESDGTVGAWGNDSSAPISCTDIKQNDDKTVGAFDQGRKPLEQEKPSEIIVAPTPKKKTGFVWGIIGALALIAAVLFIVLNNQNARAPAHSELQSSATNPTTETTDDRSQFVSESEEPLQMPMLLFNGSIPKHHSIALTSYMAVALKNDGTVVSVYEDGQGISLSSLSGWDDIISISACDNVIMGVKRDGTVVACGIDSSNNSKIESWDHIVQVDCGGIKRIGTELTYLPHFIGLKSDGTVVAEGNNREGQCEVGSWSEIIQVSAGSNHTVGLRENGTVVAVGDNSYGQCDVSDWTNIVSVAASSLYTYGVRSDGSVVVAGGANVTSENIQLSVLPDEKTIKSWENVVEVYPGFELGAACEFVFALTSDGTVLCSGGMRDNILSGYENVVDIAGASWGSTMCLLSDGTVITGTGWSASEQSQSYRLNLGWTDIKTPNRPYLVPSSIDIGDIISFGNYEKSANTDVNQELEWIVLAKNNNQILIISRDSIEAVPFGEDGVNPSWSESGIRNWLNNEFWNSAFTIIEQQSIVPTEIKNYRSSQTTDKVFLLSNDEAREYFEDDYASITVSK